MLWIFWATALSFDTSFRICRAMSRLDGVHLLESWALWQEAGRLQSVGFGARRGTRAGMDEGLWRYLHVERFWDERTARFRQLALFVAGHKGEPEDFVWRRNPARTSLHNLIELGWAFVRNTNRPIPEVWDLFALEWNDWISENPCPKLPEPLEAEYVEPEIGRRLVSLRTACEMRGWDVRSARRWCDEGRLKGAVKHGDWCIPLWAVDAYKRPSRGGKRKGAGRKREPECNFPV